MKRNTMKKYYLFSIISLLLCFTSCNDWLNVNPQGQVEAEDLYATTKGCNAALGGVYYTFSGSNLYGRNLTYGIVDILAQYWDFLRILPISFIMYPPMIINRLWQ